MATCLCATIHQLAQQPDEIRARELTIDLNAHLRDLCIVLAQSKALARSVQYKVTPVNERINKALSVRKLDLKHVQSIQERFADDVAGFWGSQDTGVTLRDLRRRITCVVVFLRSTVDPQQPVPARIVTLFNGKWNYEEVRHAGRKYLKIARKLGGLGAILELPLSIPHSTKVARILNSRRHLTTNRYERYLGLDDYEIFQHFQSIGIGGNTYTNLLQRLILHLFQGEAISTVRRYRYVLIVARRDVSPLVTL